MKRRPATDPERVERARRTAILPLAQRLTTLKRQGKNWVGCCPFHQERSPSFTVYPDHFFCFGCGATGTAIDLVMRSRGVDFGTAIQELTGDAQGAATTTDKLSVTSDGVAQASRRQDAWRRAAPVEIWRSSAPMGGLAETYLRARGLAGPFPPSLRFAPALWHAASRQALPALIAAVQAPDRRVTAIQRTYLRRDGLGKAEVAKAKLALGEFGAGAVRLAPTAPVLGLCEGVESALSAMELHRIGAWCTLGSARLSRVWLPPVVRRVVIFADADPVGRRAADAALREFCRQGREAEIRLPRIGADFNDELRSRRRSA